MKLIAEALTSTRGGRSLFSGLSFSVEGGEALLLMGPNGAGKTTLIRIVAGLLAPSAGAVRLDGGDAERSVGEQCHYVGHLNALKAGLTVEENAAFWCRFLDRAERRIGSRRRSPAFGLAELRDIPAALPLGRAEAAARPCPPAAGRAPGLAARRADRLPRPGGAGDARGGRRRPSGGGGLVVAATHVPLGFARARELHLGSRAVAGMNAFVELVRRDLLLAWKEGGSIGVALGFYLIVVTLLPLGIGPDLNLLSRIAPGILWVALLLSALLSLGRMFESDLEDGSLEVLATGPLPLPAIAAAKSLAHWLTTGVPLTVLSPLLGLLLNLQIEAYPALVLGMLAGTPAVSFIGAIGAALTLRARRGGLLLALLMLPLFVPTLIFGIEATRSAMLDSAAFLPSFLILCAISLAALVLAPLAAAAALRFQLQ